MKSLAYAIAIVFLLLVGGFSLLRRNLQDDSIPEVKDFKDQRFLFVFPHPDDEITSAGLLKLLSSQGVETTLITLTRGEAGDTNGLIDESDPEQKKLRLGQLRTQELQSVASLLGITHLEILDFPDGGLITIPTDVLKQIIQEKIAKYQPTILVTYDDRIGLYGHPDHKIIATYIKEMFLQRHGQDDFPVNQLYQVTLPQPMINTALRISDSFRQNYPTTNVALPEPTLAVNIRDVGEYKREAMLLHRSQKPTFDDMQPFFDRLPPSIYFRIFDKEYFAAVKPEG